MLGGIDIVGWVRCYKEVPMVGWGRSYLLNRGENRAGAKGLLLGGIYVVRWGSCYKVPVYGRGRSCALLNWGKSSSAEKADNLAVGKSPILGGIYVVGWGRSYKVPIYGRGRSYTLLINWGESRSSEEGLLGSGMISCKVMIGIGSGEQGAIASCIGGVDNTGCEQKEHQHELKIHELNRQPKKSKMKGCLEIGWLFLL